MRCSCRLFAATLTGTLLTGNKYLTAPTDFLAVYSMAVIENYGTANEEYHYLLNKDVNYIRAAYPRRQTQGCRSTTRSSACTGNEQHHDGRTELHLWLYAG